MVNVKVYIKGGVMGPTDLQKILDVAFALKTTHFQFGERQEIIFRIPDESATDLSRLLVGFYFEVCSESDYSRHNVVTSLLANQIVNNTFWVKDATYHDILDQFTRPMGLKINVTDLKQDLVYSFTGDVNFVASEEINYWHAYIRMHEGEQQHLVPFLIHSDDINRFSELLESIVIMHPVSWDILIEKLRYTMGDRLFEKDVAPRISVPEFFNYEGIHAYGNHKNWLGIYHRFAKFNYGELTALCNLCKQQRIGKIYITPWKSLIVKDIHDDDLTDWKFFLAHFGINNGHAESELNWEINDFDDQAQELKAYLRKTFIRHDIHSTAVIFGVNNDFEHSFSHIVINMKGNGLFAKFDVLKRHDFDPTNTQFDHYAKGIRRWHLKKVLQELIGEYHNRAFKDFANFKAQDTKTKEIKVERKSVEKHEMHQCKSCFTVYDSRYGDEQGGIPIGITFDALPSSYACPVCDASKAMYEKKEENALSAA